MMTKEQAYDTLIRAGLDPGEAGRFNSALRDLVNNRNADINDAVNRIKVTVGARTLFQDVTAVQQANPGTTQQQAWEKLGSPNTATYSSKPVAGSPTPRWGQLTGALGGDPTKRLLVGGGILLALLLIFRRR